MVPFTGHPGGIRYLFMSAEWRLRHLGD